MVGLLEMSWRPIGYPVAGLGFLDAWRADAINLGVEIFWREFVQLRKRLYTRSGEVSRNFFYSGSIF